jgi:Zn-finger nucleic acid-binding protein
VSNPICPNCRERLSFGEIGFNGLWSCIYCEGVWLPFSTVETLARATEANLTRYMAPPKGDNSYQEHLHCPKCRSNTFVPLQARGVCLSSCCSCRGLFVPKTAIAAFADSLGVETLGPMPLLSWPSRPTDIHPVDAIGSTVVLAILQVLLS